MSFYQPRFFIAAVLIHVALIFALQLGMMRPAIITPPQIQEITARLIAPPQPLPTEDIIEPPKPKPVKKETQPPKLEPTPRPVLPKPTEPSERTIEIPAVAPSEQQEPPRTAQVQEPDPPPPPPVITQPSHEASYLANPKPQYPPMSKRLNETGTVLLRVFVTADGKADNVKLKKSSGYSRLDDAALNAVREWRFLPAKSNGKPIDYWYDVPINFQLN